MNQAFYDGLIIRINGGKYTLDEIDVVIDKAAGKGFFGIDFDTVVAELKALARKHVDSAYVGNSEPRTYDLLQDIEIESNSMTSLEIFEIVSKIQEQIAALEKALTTPKKA